MSNPEHSAKLQEGIGAWNEWRAGHAITPDLRDVDLSNRDLSGIDLRGVDLRGVRFDKSRLVGALLREANLQGVDLSVAQRGLHGEQLAGADLTGATLPEELRKPYEVLQNANNLSESARRLFLVVLGATLYSWLTIATTTDVNLITNRASTPLPIIQTSIPIVGFYWVAPLLLLCVYFYFHFYLQKLWEELSSLPAILPDGRPLHAKIDPWLLNDLVRSYSPMFNTNRPFLSYFQLWISVLLAWWIVPITMFLFWGRYLPRHEGAGTMIHVALFTISLTAALRLYRLAVATLRGTERMPFRWREVLSSRRAHKTTAFVAAVGVLFGVFSWAAIKGVASRASILGVSLPLRTGGFRTGHRTWMPRLMGLVGYFPFADLTGAEVSQKKPNWTENDKSLDSVAGAQLQELDLRYVEGEGAFFAGADLIAADLTGASLRGANMRETYLFDTHLEDADLVDVNLSYARLENAHLNYARLTRADLNHADAGMRGIDLSHADLTDAIMSSARLNNANLSGANLSFAHLSGANLYHADLRAANLVRSDLSCARLSDADLSEADLRWADLTESDLGETDLRGAKFEGADLTQSNFRGAKNQSLEAVKGARHWEKAYYDIDVLKALGLPPDHNGRLARKRKEKELQLKQSAASTVPKPTMSKWWDIQVSGGSPSCMFRTRGSAFR
jgi:uncharacterized protein YjbI with pentapeptide repeats